MSGLEHSLAPIHLRECLSFTKAKTGEMNRRLHAQADINGCVLISTCNRTELYLSAAENVNPGELLCRTAGVDYGMFAEAFVTRSGEAAARHLLEVAAGLRSRIWGEDQIIAQVKAAIAIAREAGTADPLLETLFRTAVSAGKEVRSRVRLTALPTSAASQAVTLLREKSGGLAGKRALVIGNGEMGRLAASLLYQAGCCVCVTLRTYRHGETVVPPGCGVVPYEERAAHFDGLDLLISATTSPHYTVTAEQVRALSAPPRYMVDLAIPRDIQPEVGQLPGVVLYNVDDLGAVDTACDAPPEVEEILQAGLEQFYRWLNYRDCLPGLDELKSAIVQRVLTARELAAPLDVAEVVELSVSKAVDLLAGGLAEGMTPERIARCEQKIRANTTGRPVVPAPLKPGTWDCG